VFITGSNITQPSIVDQKTLVPGGGLSSCSGNNIHDALYSGSGSQTLQNTI